jgi:murein peptide amidase A
MNFDFQAHRVHNYDYLIKRWKAVARKSGVICQPYSRAEEFDLFYLRSPALKEGRSGIYLSAGIHGDEAASTEGLFQWALLHYTILKELPVMIFPCLNPWGLVNNRRTDSEGRDLNRSFHLDELPRIRDHKTVLNGFRFRLALCLHEDYDAQGVYLYEIKKRLSPFGQELLGAAGFYVPVDLRRTIEGRRAKQGWIARRVSKFPASIGLPESLYLSRNHSDRNITLETPSEYDLGLRIQAQIAAIQRAIELSFIKV